MLRHDARGSVLTEFAILLPVMLLAIMGLGDLCYRVYVRGTLEVAMQKAARDATIQGGGERVDAFDTQVLTLVRHVAPDATYVTPPVRLSYATFGRVGAERFTDSNQNNAYDAGECYDDINANNRRDSDAGSDGLGGAGDVSVYTATISFPRVFPLAGLLGWSATQRLTASTRLKNQPYATQTVATVKVICT